MKKILAIAALTAASISSAHATVNPVATNDVVNNPVVSTYTFDYTANAPSVAPQFNTTVKHIDATAADTNTVLADTTFTTDQVSTVYHVSANYAGDNLNGYTAAFSADGTTGNPSNVYATVDHNEVAHIVLIKTGEVAAGKTTVTYTVTGYRS
ncbi:hypothetical protein QCI94_003739 [Salmonella enterica]|nr:hypothetical protein [Salmonella enterica]EKS7123308.1 hypothetical protein [Salmonella enterica]EKS7251569.1 hypothetical protein [Salmonella enterica]EKS7270476.1 hypothetical protein [Salmonella enterica]EKS7282544.1 hypothetical protein [Salmonella enterica]